MANKKKSVHDRRRIQPERPLISVCMIVKDEESNLDRCLRSVQQAVDEIIVVDTGSRDRTVDIARRYGARVSHFEWCDDFAAARNAALAQATGRWILQMDADEELTPESARDIRRVVENASTQCWGFLIRCRSYKLEGNRKIHTFIHRLLLFRNHPDLRYRNRIHEQIDYIGQGVKPEFWVNDDLVVEHYGYMPEQMAAKGKEERNLRLLELATTENPDDAFQQFNLGLYYYSMERFADAVEPLRRTVALSSDPSTSFLPNAYAMLLLALCEAGREQEVSGVIAEAEQRVPTLTPDFYCNAGTALRMIGEQEQALRCFQRAIDVGDVRIGSEFDPNSRTWLPRFGIGTIYEIQGKMDLAQLYYEEALAYVPKNPELNCRLAVVVMNAGQMERAFQHVKIALQADVVPEHVCWELLQTCERVADAAAHGKPTPTDLQKVVGELLERIPLTPEVGVKLAGICVRFEKFERGVAAANASLERGEDLLARVNRALCYFNLGRYQEAADDFTAALALAQDDPHSAGGLAIVKQLKQMMNGSLNLPAGPKSEPGDSKTTDSPAVADPDGEPEGLVALVSIIIPVFDKVECTKRCIQAIAENTSDDLYEVIIVDNASTHGTKDFLSLLSGDVRIITNTTNPGFAKACNQAAQVAQSKYLVFLNDETEPQKGWLESLTVLAEMDPLVGGVGPKLLYPNGTERETAGIVAPDGTLEAYGKSMDSAALIDQAAREVDYCSLVSLLVRRDLWNEIGGFDASYFSEQYQAADLCSAIRRAGCRVMYQPAAEVIDHRVVV